MSTFDIKVRGGKIYTSNISAGPFTIFESLGKESLSLDNAVEILLEKQKLKMQAEMFLSKSDKQKDIENDVTPVNTRSNKSQIKTNVKQEIKKKFKRGSFICLRTKGKGSAKRIERIYQIKQIVWSMNDIILKALVVKQISGPNYNMFSLNPTDCARVHVKYEPGLQFLSMELPWIPAKIK